MATLLRRSVPILEKPGSKEVDLQRPYEMRVFKGRRSNLDDGL
jgi:hypothetical protein